MKIVVLGGGISPERHVSFETSKSILEILRTMGHKAIFVDMFLGSEAVDEHLDSLFDREDGLICDLIKSENTSLKVINDMYKGRNGCVVGPNVFEICKLADFVFISLHGEYGEDGRIQGALDLLGIPYNGSDNLGSAIAMNKAVSRQIMEINGISVAPLVNNAPCVLKQINGGSSIGLHICDTDKELETALSEISEYDCDYIIERKIEGTEVSVGVLDDMALLPIEVIPPTGKILDYEAKYSQGENAMRVYCPARISEQKTKEVQALAMKLHKSMNLSGYSRTDFIIDHSGKIWGLEVNTLPGFTNTSFIPLAAERSGITMAELCDKIINAGIERCRKRENF